MTERRIWSFGPLRPCVTERLTMPRGAELLDVTYVVDSILVWALVDPDAEEIERDIRVYSAGEAVHEGARHLSTWQAGPFTWHAFDLGEVGQ